MGWLGPRLAESVGSRLLLFGAVQGRSAHQDANDFQADAELHIATGTDMAATWLGNLALGACRSELLAFIAASSQS